ncbi:MAG: AAA family ATPase, partial [Mucispirillum sp.]|nr:AAA family ATPase [Mucispirillum sp.]
AERVGPRKVYERIDNNYDFIDMHGRLAPFFYHQKQNENMSELAVDNMEDTTLRSQVVYWLKHILDTTVKTENIQDNIIVSYQAPHDVEAYSPLNTGFGTSMVFPILIACLTAKIGDTVIIENPEVHLHPKAQSKLADFFAFIAQLGVQVILETHCEHLIYKLCYNVNQGIIDYDKVVFQYKEINKPFQAIYTDKKGRFVDKENNQRKFPTGFFDATLTDYLKIYR